MLTLNKLRSKFDILMNRDSSHSYGTRLNAFAGYQNLFKTDLLDTETDPLPIIQTYGAHLDSFVRLAENPKEHPEIRAAALSYQLHLSMLHINARAQAERKEGNFEVIELANREIDVTWLMDSTLKLAEQKPPLPVQLSALRAFGAVANVTKATLLPEFDRNYYDDRITVIALNASDRRVTDLALKYCVR